jgi:hypothetical protein
MCLDPKDNVPTLLLQCHADLGKIVHTVGSVSTSILLTGMNTKFGIKLCNLIPRRGVAEDPRLLLRTVCVPPHDVSDTRAASPTVT